MGNSNSHQSREEPSRRSILKSMSAGGAGFVAASSSSVLTEFQIFDSAEAATNDRDKIANNSLIIESNDRIEYEFSVTGLLSAVDAPSAAVKEGTGSAVLKNNSHEFSFTGEFTTFDIKGDATVTIDGETFDYESFPHNTLEIVANEPVSYDISASGAVEIEQDENTGSDARRATGTITGNSKQTLSYAGELTHLDIDGDATVLNNRTKIDPDEPLPSIESSQAKIQALGTEQDYRLHLGWDVTVQSEFNTVDDIDQGIAHGTATSKPDKFSFNGLFQLIDVPDVGVIKNPLTTQTVEFISATNNRTTFTIFTPNSVEKEFTLEPNNVKVSKLDGQITKIRMESENSLERTGIQIDINSSATANAVERAKKLQIAAKLERESEFKPLVTHAEARGGRIRTDSEGIKGWFFREPGDPRDQSSRDVYMAARYELTDIDGKDEIFIILKKNITTNEMEQAQLHHRFRSDQNTPLSTEVGELSIESSEKDQRIATESIELQNHNQITTETIYTSDIYDEGQYQTTDSDRTVLRTAKFEYELEEELKQQSIYIDPCEVDWIPCNDVREAFEDGASEAGKSADWVKNQASDVVDTAEDGIDVITDSAADTMMIALNSATAVADWGYELDKYTGFVDRGAAAFNYSLQGAGMIGTFFLQLSSNGDINSCSGCQAFSRSVIDAGVDTVTVAGCGSVGTITGGTGTLGCSMAASVVNEHVLESTYEWGTGKFCHDTIGTC